MFGRIFGLISMLRKHLLLDCCIPILNMIDNEEVSFLRFLHDIEFTLIAESEETIQFCSDKNVNNYLVILRNEYVTKLKDEQGNFDSSNELPRLEANIKSSVKRKLLILSNYVQLVHAFVQHDQEKVLEFCSEIEKLLAELKKNQSSDFLLLVKAKLLLLKAEVEFRKRDSNQFPFSILAFPELEPQLKEIQKPEDNVTNRIVSLVLADYYYFKGKYRLFMGKCADARDLFKKAVASYESLWPSEDNAAIDPLFRKAFCYIMLHHTVRLSKYTSDNIESQSSTLDETREFKDLQLSYKTWVTSSQVSQVSTVHWTSLPYFRELSAFGCEEISLELSSNKKEGELCNITSLEFYLALEEGLQRCLANNVGFSIDRPKVERLEITEINRCILLVYCLLSQRKSGNVLAIRGCLDLEDKMEKLKENYFPVCIFWYKKCCIAVVDFYFNTNNFPKLDNVMSEVENCRILDDSLKQELMEIAKKHESNESKFSLLRSTAAGRACFFSFFTKEDKASSEIDEKRFQGLCEKLGMEPEKYFLHNRLDYFKQIMNEIASNVDKYEVLILFLTGHGISGKRGNELEFSTYLEAGHNCDLISVVKDVERELKNAMDDRGCSTFCWLIVDTCRGVEPMKRAVNDDGAPCGDSPVAPGTVRSHEPGCVTSDNLHSEYEAEIVDESEAQNWEGQLFPANEMSSGNIEERYLVEACDLNWSDPPNFNRGPCRIFVSYSTLPGYASVVPEEQGGGPYSPYVKSLYEVFVESSASFIGEGPWKMTSLLNEVNRRTGRYKKTVNKNKMGETIPPYYETQKCVYETASIGNVVLVKQTIDYVKQQFESLTQRIRQLDLTEDIF